MTQLVERAAEILRSNELLSFFSDWQQTGEVTRKDRKALKFNAPKPNVEPGRFTIVYIPGGDLYVYEDGDVEFVDSFDGDDELSVSLEEIRAAQAIMDAQIFSPGFCFQELMTGNEGQTLLKFSDPDFMLLATHILVDPKKCTAEYVPDSDLGTDDIPF